MSENENTQQSPVTPQTESDPEQVDSDQTGAGVSEGAGLGAEGEQTEAERQQAEEDGA